MSLWTVILFGITFLGLSPGLAAQAPTTTTNSNPVPPAVNQRPPGRMDVTDRVM